MDNQPYIQFKIDILSGIALLCYNLFQIWASHRWPVNVENTNNAVDAYINFQQGIIVNKDFCPRLQSHPSIQFTNESKEIILEFGEHIYDNQPLVTDECAFKIKKPVRGQYKRAYLISSFLMFGTNTKGHLAKSTSCHDHIKFQRRTLRKTVVPSVICNGYRHKTSVNITQRRFDPLLWFNPAYQLGVYFKQPWNRTHINATPHLIFKLLKKGGDCEFRIQRYKISPNCSTSDQLGYRSLISHCEVIKCSQQKRLLKWIQEIPWSWKTGKSSQTPEMTYEYNELGWNINFKGNLSENEDLLEVIVLIGLLCAVTLCLYNCFVLVITIKLVDGEEKEASSPNAMVLAASKRKRWKAVDHKPKRCPKNRTRIPKTKSTLLWRRGPVKIEFQRLPLFNLLRGNN